MSTSTEVVELTPSERDKWNELVRSSPQGTVFHRWEWLNAVSEARAAAIKIIGVYKGGVLIGGCAFAVVKMPFLKLAYSPAPNSLTYYGGLVLRESSTRHVRKVERLYKQVTNAVVDWFEAQGFNWVQLVNFPSLVDTRFFQWRGWRVGVRYTSFLEFRGQEDFLNNIHDSARRAIKSAIRHGVIVEERLSPSIIFELYRQTRERRGLLYTSLRLFERLYELFRRGLIEAHQFNAYNKQGEVLASTVFVSDKKRYYYWVSGTRKDVALHNAPSLILYHAVSALNPSKPIDFTGANTPEVAKFKSGFNPKLTPFYVVEKPSSRYSLGKKVKSYIKALTR